MKRVIVDYAKLTNEILTLLVEKFPDGYDDTDIIRFKNAKNETVEAVEVRTEDTIYLVKVSLKLADRIENFEDEDDDLVVDLVVTKPPIKDIEDEVEDDDDDDDSYGNDKPEFDDEDDEDEKDSLDDEDDE
jgi:DNA-directed RNA polymerase subunit delta